MSNTRCFSVPEPEPICDTCGKVIPARDILVFQDEAGDDSLPCCCQDCAEMEALP